MGLFGGGSSVSTSAQRISSFQVNQSSYGSPIKLIFGTAMISGVLLDYQDFTAHAIETTTTSGGKGGGEVTQTDVKYTYTVAGVVALGEGVCARVGQVWADSKTTDLASLNLTFFSGEKAQRPWGYMVTEHPDHALTYSGTSYLAGVVDLGDSASLPNMNFEVYGLCQSTDSSVEPTTEKMQQFSYQKEIEISNFSSNRYVEEYVFDSASGTGSWLRLDSKYYTIEQAQDSLEEAKEDVYVYTFNFDDRDDGGDRVDPTYIRIYYTAVRATVDYTPTDANPRDIIWTLLTSTVYGENFPAVLIDEESLAVYSTYCKNNQLLISPVYGDQTSCSDIIGSLMECTNSEYVFSQGKVKIIPYWDGLPPNYAIKDSNIIDQGEDTLRIERTSQADTYNIIPLEHTSRADQYNSNVVYATDEGDIELHGVRQAGTFSHPEIMNQSLAQAVAQLILQKQLYNRNRYTLKLGQEFILLEPMDAVTLESDLAKLGITTVRVVEIVESAEDYTLEITFEDNLSGTTSAEDYDVQVAERAVSETNAQPGNVNAPIMGEVPLPMVTSATNNEFWIYASGSSKWWGGCSVWCSSDGESYGRLGRISQPARQGYSTSRLLPDQNSFTVDLSMSRSSLSSVSARDAENNVTLCWIGGSNGGEFIAYQTVELIGKYQYRLSGLRRGIYNSTIVEHPSHAEFVRCDNNVPLKIPFGVDIAGQQFWLKFCSINVFGTVEQPLSDVTPYPVTVQAVNRGSATESGTVTVTMGETTTITYARAYREPPRPQAIITDGVFGDVLNISNETATGFDVYVYHDDNANGGGIVDDIVDDVVDDDSDETRTVNYIVYGDVI